MYNDILTIGNLTIHGYGLMIAIGVLVALIWGDKRATRRGLDGEFIYTLVMWTVVLGFCAAKILFIITYFKQFIADPLGFIRGSGFVVFGGIIGGLATIYGYCKIKKKSFIDYIDVMIPLVAVAQGFGRIGCFLAGCCYGRQTDSWFSIVFKHSDFAPNNVKLLPTQLMMSVGDFIIAAIIILYVNKLDKKVMEEKKLDTIPANHGGKPTLLYLIAYSIGRFFVEFFRNDYRGSVGVLSTSQFIGLIMAIICSVILFYFLPKKEAKKNVDM